MSTRKRRSLVPRCKLPRETQKKLIDFFLSGCTTRESAARAFVNRNTATIFFRKLRRIIATRQRQHIGGDVEVDETYLSGGEGGRKKSRRGRSLVGKIALVGIVERGTRKLHISLLRKVVLATRSLTPERIKRLVYRHFEGRNTRPLAAVHTEVKEQIV